MTEHFWLPVSYPIDVKYKGEREYTRVVAVETVPVPVPELETEGDPVCTMLADNETPVSWYRSGSAFYRTLVGRDGRRMTMEQLADVAGRAATKACMLNTGTGPESGVDQPGAYDSRFRPDPAGALLYEDVVAGQHPLWAGQSRKPRDIIRNEKDGAFEAAMNRIKSVRRIGDVPVIEASLPTYALRVMPMLPVIDIIPHLDTSTFVGNCITVPFGIGELELARQCARELAADPRIGREERPYILEDRADRLTLNDAALTDHVDPARQDYLFLKNTALSLYTMMRWDKFEDIPYEALHGYTAARAAIHAYEAGNPEPVAEVMTSFRRAEPTGYESFDIAAISARVVAAARAERNAEFVEELADFKP